MQYTDQPIFLDFLASSKIFDADAKKVIKRAVETEMLPDIDYAYLFDVFKMEKNMHAIVDQRADAMIKGLKKKHKKDE